MMCLRSPVRTHFSTFRARSDAPGTFSRRILLIRDLRVDQQCLLSVRSAPLVSELMETCIDDVLKAPGVPAATAADEAGPSGTYAAPGATGEDPLSLGGEVVLGSGKPPPPKKKQTPASFRRDDGNGGLFSQC